VSLRAASFVISLVLAHAALAQDAQQNSAAASGNITLTRVCFSVTLQCFGGVRTSDGTRLDLSAPPIASVLPRNELETILPDPDELRLDEPLVKVEGERGVPVNVPVGIMSLPWAVRHPTQFWRIFLPSPSRMTKDDD
jgi:hypothetical protein